VPKFTVPSLDAISNNPIAAMGMDFAAEIVGDVTQTLLNQALGKLTKGLSGVEGAVGSFFTTLALAATAGVEFAMELARGNARLILKKIKEKDDAIAILKEDITALNNALEMLLNSDPYFDKYVAELIIAYGLIDNSNKQLKSVVSTLKAAHFYNDKQYARALSNLIKANEKILPDKSADISAIRSGKLEDTVAGGNAKKAAAAALTIPGIVANITKHFIVYSKVTYELNGLIFAFNNALDSFITSYSRNDNIDKATIDHITGGTTQLDSLLGQMNVLLFPTPEVGSSPVYVAKIMGAASLWGVQLTTVVEWLKVEPGKASKQLDLTGESVNRYKAARAILMSQGNLTFGTYTLTVNESQENVIATAKDVVLIATAANTVVSTQKLSKDVKAKVRQLNDLFSASKSLDTRIKNAVTPFVNTPNNLIQGMDKVVGDLSSLAKSLGLDRAANLMASANITGLLAMTAETATFIGAAVLGFRTILKALEGNPNATDQDKTKLTESADQASREKATKSIEASRSSSDTSATYAKDRKTRAQKISKQTTEATKIATKYEVEGATETVQSELTAIADDFQNVTHNKGAFL
jgi:hypothetical protein